MRKFIIELISNGRGLEDAAGKCGHDEELADWKKSVKTIMKSLNITNTEIEKFEQEFWEKENIKKQEFLEKENIKKQKEKAVKDAAFLKEMGL
jgi:hypothetical protein